MAHTAGRKVAPIPRIDPTGKGRVTAATWTEVPILSIDARGWSRRRIDGAQAQRLLADVGEFVKKKFASGNQHHDERARRAVATTPMLDGEGCVLVTVEFRECRDEQGNVHMCRCEFYQCADGSSFWQCTPI